MNRLMMALAASTILAAAMPAYAQMGGSKEGSGETPRGAAIEGRQLGKATPISPKLGKDEATRDVITDEKAAVESFAVVTHKDGKDTVSEPSEALRDIIVKEMSAAPSEMKSSGEEAKKGEDPALKDEAERQVFGDDDRVQITNTKTFPFSAFGYIEGKAKEGFASCSGTLIGPRTVLTAAHCVYNHEDKDWLSDIIFAPGVNGPDNAPFGAYQAESVSIVEGFVKNYQGFYGSVVPWDLGIITLAEPVGDSVGYLGYANYENLGDFAANIVGYPGDKPPATMWRATCNVTAANVGAENFQYDCDTYPGSSGSSVYAYDEGAKARVVTGVNVAESPDANTAVRINATYVEWINGLWK